jgi:hypothetical protein
MATASNIRLPDPLSITGSDVADNWRRFREQWDNYVLAADLEDASSEKQAAILLTCVGGEAYDVFRSFEFASAADRKKIDKVTEAFENFCVGQVNVTYERYTFNRRMQENGERFDVFLGDVRRLARSCAFGDVTESMIRDRLVVGIRDDPTRRKLLQIRDLTLNKAIDLCRASEAAGQQLKAMAGPDEVQALNSSHSSRRSGLASHGRRHNRSKSRGGGRERDQRAKGDDHSGDSKSARRCKFCNRNHVMKKESCAAFGKTCNACSGKNHFAASSACKKATHEVCRLNDDYEELMTVGVDPSEPRWFTRLLINGRREVRFLIDCGATVNLLPVADVRALGCIGDVRPSSNKLRMFDRSALKTSGIVTLTARHPKTGIDFSLDFYVAERHEQAVLGVKACQQLRLLHVDEDVVCVCEVCTASNITSSTPACKSAADIVAEYPDVFEGLGKMAGTVHLDIDETVPPVQMPLRRLPIGVKEKVAAELRRLEALDVIAPVTEPTPWVSALLVVTKANGDIRVCIDPSPLNRALKRPTYYMSTVDDVLPKLAGVKVFSSADMKDGFWHLQLDDASSRLTTFETPFGRYRWKRLCFGVLPAPEIFTSRVNAAISGLSGIECIADDLLICGRGSTVAEATADHNKNLAALLQRCREQGLRLNKAKLKLNRQSLIYCGHELTRDGVKPAQSKIDAISNMPAPVDKKGVMRLLGMATYLSRYCENFSHVTAPIRDLLKQDCEFIWRPEVHGVAFEKLKTILSSAPALAYFDPKAEVTVQADASQYGLGAVILCNGRPVEYASRALTSTEANAYAQIEKELLAVVFAMERFHFMVYGRKVTCVTDHKPLLTICKKSLASAPKRLQRMLLRLQKYDFDLIYTPGSQLVIPDTLSRAFQPSTSGQAPFTEDIATMDEHVASLRLVASENTISLLRSAAAVDDEYQMLVRQIRMGWPDDKADLPPSIVPYATFADEVVVGDGLVFKGARVVVPYGARQAMLTKLHSSHIGLNGCQRRARETFYYPGVTADIKKLIAACEVCSRFQTEQQREPMLSHEIPTRPWQAVGVDIFTDGNIDYLVTVCCLSGYFEVDRLPSKKISDVVYILRQQMARHGIPEVLYSDNSPFGAVEFQRFAAKWEFRNVRSSPRYPQSNSFAEAAVKSARRLITKSREAGTDPLLALLAQRNTPSEHRQLSPAQMMFGRRTRTTLPTAETLLSTPSGEFVNRTLASRRAEQAAYYNRGTRERPVLPVGQTVRMRFAENDWRKGEVSKSLPHRSYEVRMEDGTTRRRTSRHVKFSSEPPTVVTFDTDDESGSPVTATTSTERAERPAKQPMCGKHAAVAPKSTSAVVTRSGRAIRKPARYRDN